MKRKLYLIIISIIIITLVGCTAKTPDLSNNGSSKDDIVENEGDTIEDEEDNLEEEILTIEDYYPFKENLIMEYEGRGNEYAEQKTFIEFVEGNRAQMKISNPGTNLVKVIEYKNGTLTEVFSQEEFYHIENMINANTNSQEIILKEPLEIGTSWSTEEGRKKKITSVDAEIETPAGNYRALEVTTELDQGGNQKDYYAKGIGLVGRVYKDGDFEVTTLLKEIKKDNYTMDIVTYYPTSRDIGTEYLVQEIKFATNDQIEDLLEKIMKEAPSDKLMPVISKGTRINKINLNRNSWTLEVDFSKELLTESNAGSSLEGEILKSIVNTLGEFYGVEKVYISIEDEPYESGHYALEENDFFQVDKSGINEFKE